MNSGWASAGEAVERSAFVTRSMKHIHDPPLVLGCLQEKKSQVRPQNQYKERETHLVATTIWSFVYMCVADATRLGITVDLFP